VVLMPPSPLNASEGGSGSNGSSGSSGSARYSMGGGGGHAVALEASLEAVQRQLAAVQGSLHLALLLGAVAVFGLLLTCCGALGFCCCACLCARRLKPPPGLPAPPPKLDLAAPLAPQEPSSPVSSNPPLCANT
jgi:hypothetical protein